MAANESDIQELRTQLQASRWQLHDTLQQLEDKFNVPRRIKSELAEHPLKWAALAVGAGVVAATVVPLLLRTGNKRWLGSLVGPALRVGLMTALPKILHAKAPDLFGAKAT